MREIRSDNEWIINIKRRQTLKTNTCTCREGENERRRDVRCEGQTVSQQITRKSENLKKKFKDAYV